ncbi:MULTISPECIES: efflux RND transporter periplasmic adaptor subunit [Marivita]|uniref:HlyD family efflux transporter periplasmic adaptor subunit n=1 Tax=Marivita cryptomonadis TaxID=505252 RepID=A0A9Q2NXJ7_9RHOB|nr:MULTISPECIES: HlyD family efflux transporter periplasmic adaptor subunit [Marivita]MCR9169421.1 HlyD family efflux transporter periplasmic adaptor subunit [Paracoccaceae bacterium]MBM2321709.1 HlyD family efflux transporter periplasmic adaptor subunit [Marivita cryptomonadis]MBM2331290.1 HlyD family efflux transporter periplasmic adaptor subunit [Marivita cryptomonadis]MBM2340876.1 HlyD family efflux transporter periplasmic adaptor subunit [Marivita cryptomonadis]MBM2345538.1 HlyD family ef
MRFLRRSLTGLFLLSLTLGLLAYAGVQVRDAVQERMAQEPRSFPQRERVFAVNIVPANFETVTPVLTAFGQIDSVRTLELRAAVGGRVLEIAPEFIEGGSVTEGQMLVRIDPTDAEAVLQRVESDILDAEAEKREAERAIILARDELVAADEQATLRERAYQRQVDLQDRGVGTAAAVEVAELAAAQARQAVLSRRQAVAQAEARIDQATTRLSRAVIAEAEAQRRLDDTLITADFSGTLADVSVVQGRLVSSNEQLARLIDADALEVAFRVSTQQFARLLDESGQLTQSDVTVILDVFGTNLTATGTLSRAGAAVGDGQTGRQLFATLNSAPGFRPGDFVTVQIDEPPLENVAHLPASALNAANEVLVIEGEDRLEVFSVNLLRRQGDDVLVRARGLEGREVVAERTPLLGAGIKVRPLREAGQAAPEEPEMVELTEERRARLTAFVQSNTRMPEEARQRILQQLSQGTVPAQVVERIESRMGG